MAYFEVFQFCDMFLASWRPTAFNHPRYFGEDCFAPLSIPPSFIILKGSDLPAFCPHFGPCAVLSGFKRWLLMPL